MAKPWIVLTPTHLKSAMTSDEAARFGKAVTDGAPDDRMVPILADLTQEIRGAIKSCKQNTVSADESKIPEEFKTRALAIARWRLLITIPGYQPGKAREDEKTDAIAFLRDVAKCVFRPEEADDAVTPQVPSAAPSPVPLIKSQCRRFTRESQDGI